MADYTVIYFRNVDLGYAPDPKLGLKQTIDNSQIENQI